MDGALTLEARLDAILRADAVVWPALEAAARLGLPGWRIVSGAIVGAVWNAATGRPAGHGLRDLDLFYFDPDTSWAAEDRAIRRAALADERFEVRNQARVHLWYAERFGHAVAPLASVEESLGRFVARTQAVGVRLADGQLDIAAPFGLGDLFAMRMVPNPVLPNAATYAEKAARWQAHWPEIDVLPWAVVTVAREADWAALLALIHAAFGAMAGRIDPPSSAMALTPATLAEKAARETLLLAHLDGALAGCAFVAETGDAACLSKLAVAPVLQRRGVGRALVAAAEAEARARGLRRLRLETRIELLETQAAFAAMGFEQVGTTAHPGYARPTSVTLEKAV